MNRNNKREVIVVLALVIAAILFAAALDLIKGRQTAESDVVYISAEELSIISSKGTDEPDNVRFKTEYESLNGITREDDDVYLAPVSVPEDNPFKYSTEDEVLQLLNEKGTGCVYFGGSWCRYCRLVVPTLADLAEEVNYIPAIYDNDYSENESYQALAEQVYEYVAKKDTAFANVTGTTKTIENYLSYCESDGVYIQPSTIIFINKGVIVGVNMGTVPDHKSTSEPLSEQELIELKETLTNHLEKLGTNPCPTKC